MNKVNLSILWFFIASVFVVSCSKEDDATLSEEDQKAIVLAVFNVGADGISRTEKSGTIVDSPTGQYPVDENFEYDYPDGHGGSIHVTVDIGGYVTLDDNSASCLGAFFMVSVTEKIYHFRVELPNGREVYVDADPGVVFSGNYTFLTGCTTFDTNKTFFNIQGVFKVNGIEYDMMLTGGKINSDGTCHHIGGFINGIPVSFDF